MKRVIAIIAMMAALAVTAQTVIIGETEWMTTNLNIGTMIPASVMQTDNDLIEKYCLNNKEANCAVYGGLYQWDELMAYAARGEQGICPDGWRVPELSEWYRLIEAYSQPGENWTLEEFLTGSYNSAGVGLKHQSWYPSNWPVNYKDYKGMRIQALNSSGMGLLPGGFALSRNGVGVFDTGKWLGKYWTATKVNSKVQYPNYADQNEYPVEVRLRKYDNKAEANIETPAAGLSVRCVRTVNK